MLLYELWNNCKINLCVRFTPGNQKHFITGTQDNFLRPTHKTGSIIHAELLTLFHDWTGLRNYSGKWTFLNRKHRNGRTIIFAVNVSVREKNIAQLTLWKVDRVYHNVFI